MAQDFLRNFRDESRQLFELPHVNKPTIKILLYTDAPNLVTTRRVGSFSLGRMIEHLEGHSPAFANLEIRWESRYRDNSLTANNKLHDLLEAEAKTGEPFDQIWFFGIHQINRTSPDVGLGGGTRESELTADEVTALTKWMDQHQGGVLVTGDHANERPSDFIADDPNPLCPDTARTERFLSLGRALGRCIPRAGQMRDWEGDPTSDRGHRASTVVLVHGTGINDPGLDRDPQPQQIALQHFDETGRPTDIGRPHPLFFYNDEQSIQFLPDHRHEGTVQLPPNIADETVWKRNAEGFQPQPHIVATGIDRDRGGPANLLAVYDGTAVNVGRIVADSSWHHYFNVNLENLMFPAAPATPADQIGQFYSNLAVWLCPVHKRQQMANAMVQWLARNPVTLEVVGPILTEKLSELLGTGSAALAVLKRVASPCEVHELLQMVLTAERRKKVETVHFPEKSAGLTTLPSKELVLGYMVNRFSLKSKEFRHLEANDSKALIKATQTESIDASELAFRRQRREVTRALKAAEELSPLPT